MDPTCTTVLKVSYEGETRRIRLGLSHVENFDVMKQALIDLFPSIDSTLPSIRDRVSIFDRSSDQLLHSMNELKAAISNQSGPESRLALAIRVSSQPQCSRRSKMKSHYLKLGDPVPADIQARANSLPPVQIQAAGVDEWELVDQVDDVSNQPLANVFEHHSVSAARHFAENIRSPPTATLGDQGSFQFYLNHQLQQPDTSKLPTDLTLAHFIRNFAKLTGTKIGCGEGGCGACTVLLSYINPSDGRPVSVPVNSCLRPLLSCNGMSVTTIEGIGSPVSGYHPVQTRLAQNAGTQCGYCSPGFGMNAFSLLVNSPKPTELQVENQFSGNICRCTGYRPILEAYRSFCKPHAADSHQSEVVGSCGKSCATCTDHACPSAGAAVDIEDLHPLPYALRQAGHTSWISCGSDGSFEQKWLQATIEELSKMKTIGPSKLIRFDSKSNWFQPSSLADVYQLLNTFSNVPVRLVVGNTSTGVVKYYPHVPTDTPSVYVDISRISELNTVSVDSFGVHVGAALSLQALIAKLSDLVNDPKTPSKLTATFPSLISHLERIGNVQVRSVGSWAGNFMTAKQHAEFPSDFVTMMSAYRSIIEWTSASRGKQCFDVLTSLKYMQSADEFVSKLHIPFSADGQLFDSFKIAARHQNSHAIVNASFNIFVDSNNRVTDGTIVFGGIKRGPLSCTQTVAILIGQVLSPLLLQQALPVLQAECTPDQHSAIGSFVLESPSYRQSCATTLFYRYVLAHWFSTASLPPRIQSATAAFDRPISSGIQVFSSNSAEAPVSYPIPKISGILQTSGEAQYSNDLPIFPNTLFAAYSKSTQPSAKLVSIDASEALKLPGVISFLSARSIAEIGGVNSCGMFPGDEEVFASVDVGYVGQPIGMIVAETQELAERAAALVSATYDATDYPSPIFTIDQAIAAGSYLPDNQYIQHVPSIIRGDVEKGFAQSAFVLDGNMELGAQTAFYMETQTTIAHFEENQVLRITSSTQGAADLRSTVASVLGCSSSKVIVDAPRMGGGFGSKLTRGRPLAAAVAVAAKLLNRPVRAQLSRNDDMDIIGKRNPYQISYKVGFNKDGSIQALQCKLWNNGGFNYDLTLPLMDNAQQWMDNCYFVPNWKSEGVCCKTNLPPFTAMRTPGALEAIQFFEQIIERIAFTLGIESRLVREKNFYQNGQLTPYGQPLENVTLPQVWSTVIQQSDYENRLKSVQLFNSENRWFKKGLSLLPVKYGFVLGEVQQTCMVHILHEDGSVVITHSGAEIGQGLTTKVMQAVAFGLGVDLSIISCRPSSTDKVPNFTMTGSSTTSEAVCQAALNACSQLSAIISKYRTAGVKWADAIAAASAANENLNVTGWYAPPNPKYLFSYYVYGAAVTEVLVDVLTGETHVLRTDIAYDAGISLNPIIDIGQIEGAFVQGIGFFLTEECVYDPKTGRLINNGTWDYKPPSSQDIPVDFRVTLLSNTPNSNGILRSKGSGEPPYCLAGSVLFATQMAVAAARAESQKSDFVSLKVPATVPTIQQACGVDISQLVV